MQPKVNTPNASAGDNINTTHSVFRNQDLRSKKFVNTNLKDAVFEKCNMGISPFNGVVIFIIAACLSLTAGYIAMLSGSAVQALLTAKEPRLQLAGYIICVLFLTSVAIAIGRGLNYSSARLALIMIGLVILIGLISYFTDAAGAGIGALYGVATLLLVFIMLLIGAIARATAGSLQSTLLFMIVAMGGGIFAKSLGGGIGTLIMTIATVVISKKALKSNKDSLIKNITLRISTAFGTSFKNTNLSGASFNDMVIKNSNFQGAQMDNIKLHNTTESLCYYGSSKNTLTNNIPSG